MLAEDRNPNSRKRSSSAGNSKFLGEALIRHIEAVAGGEQLLISTNLSNQRMQRLVKRLGYTICGFVDQLDPGDPELVFTKRLK